jgi:hypothetical protein
MDGDAPCQPSQADIPCPVDMLVLAARILAAALSDLRIVDVAILSPNLNGLDHWRNILIALKMPRKGRRQGKLVTWPGL